MAGPSSANSTAFDRRTLEGELRTCLSRRRIATLEYAARSEATTNALEAATIAPLDLAHLERRIAELQGILDRGGAWDAESRAADTAGAGGRVAVRWDDGTVETYTFVRPAEIDPRGGWISADSPIGRGLLGRCPGERVAITTPAGPGHLVVVAVH
jgi:transcription elongation GreA/GreB family factor